MCLKRLTRCRWGVGLQVPGMFPSVEASWPGQAQYYQALLFSIRPVGLNRGGKYVLLSSEVGL